MSATATPSAIQRPRSSTPARSPENANIAAIPHTAPSAYGMKNPARGTASAIRICRKNPNAVNAHTAASNHLSRPII